MPHALAGFMNGISRRSLHRKLKVLILGGSSFIGRTLLKHLKDADAEVSVINRGRLYWNTPCTSSNLKANLSVDNGVKHYKADRKSSSYASAVQLATSDVGGKWDAVFDSSAFEVDDLRRVVPFLLPRTGVYYFISTDSVYEVALDEALKESPITEACAVRPSDPSAVRSLRRADTYGDDKLRCEEYLQKTVSEMQPILPTLGVVVSARLADVVGPFDDTLRWVGLGVTAAAVPENGVLKLRRGDMGRPLNFTFSGDVVGLFLAFLVVVCQMRNDAGAEKLVSVCERQGWLGRVGGVFEDAQSKGEVVAVNLCCAETCSLVDLVAWSREWLLGSKGGVRVEYVDRGGVCLLPSIERRWQPLCTSKLRHLLGFEPTPLRNALKEGLDFLQVMCKEHHTEVNEVLNEKVPADHFAGAVDVLKKVSAGAFGEADIVMEDSSDSSSSASSTSSSSSSSCSSDSSTDSD